MPEKINRNLIFLFGCILVFLAIMIACEQAFHDGQIFQLLGGAITMLLTVLIGAFKNVFHMPDVVPPPPGGTTTSNTSIHTPAAAPIAAVVPNVPLP
jgi:hypothetical protein